MCCIAIVSLYLIQSTVFSRYKLIRALLSSWNYSFNFSVSLIFAFGEINTKYKANVPKNRTWPLFEIVDLFTADKVICKS